MEITPGFIAKTFFWTHAGATFACVYASSVKQQQIELVGYCFAHTLPSDKEAIQREADVSH